MFRLVCAISACLAVIAVSTVHAQPRICKKVDVSFACRNGGTGTGTYNCRKGETEARCCARYRKRAAGLRRGWCTGRNGGLASFQCGCSKKGRGAARVKQLAPLAGNKSVSGGRPQPKSKSKGNVETTWKIEEGEKAEPADPRLRLPGSRGGGAAACREVKYKFACRAQGGASGKAGCRPGEGKAACCKRVVKLARESCEGHGLVVQFECDCPPRGGAGGLGRGWRGGKSSGPRRTGEHGKGTERPGLMRARACRRVTFTYDCRGRRRNGGRECRRNESERDCCAHAFSVETRNCGRPPENWRCRCPDRTRGGRLERPGRREHRR